MAEVQGLETAFLGEWEGETAGLLVMRTAPTLSGADDWAEITEMYVRPKFRRQGSAGRWWRQHWITAAGGAAVSFICWSIPRTK